MADLSQLTHRWRHTPDPRGLPHVGRWDCPDCLCGHEGPPPDYLCPDRTAAALDAARLDGVRAGLEAGARECETQAGPADQDIDSIQHCYAIGAARACAKTIRALDPAAVVDQHKE